MAYVLSYDIGTTGVKTCLYNVTDKIEYVGAKKRDYNLYILDNGGAEQDPDEWWDAMKTTTRELIKSTGIEPVEIKGISFCSQMQGLVLVDREGNALRRAMSYMDQRATEEIKKGIAYGIQIAGANIFKLLKSLYLTGAVSSSVKDPVWKYKWVEAHEKELFAKVYKWLDVKEYLLLRCTGEFVMTEDSAYSTFLYSTRKRHKGWHKTLCKIYGVNPEHLPKLIKTTDLVGGLTAKAAEELGLAEATPVFGGGGDATLIGVGAGCVNPGQTHIYWGTSGWVSTVVSKQLVDTTAMIAAIVGAEENKYNYFAEMETAGKCMAWVKENIANKDSFEEMIELAVKAPAGSSGVLFAPWLHGNRCPFEDPTAAGMFYNLKIETNKSDILRSVIEGICFHLRWMLECEDKKVKTGEAVRFVGGGAVSYDICQILADIIGRRVEVVKDPRNVGAVGAAAIVGVGLNRIDSLSSVRDFVPIEKTFEPRDSYKERYDKNYREFKMLYKENKHMFHKIAKIH
ncbi:MAG: FGGY-family carbohydrate kinase [Lachnospiraceae bacterium]|nr:FGGY-family carbohydrate kinase [Lachnospiraceae bacterium]